MRYEPHCSSPFNQKKKEKLEEKLIDLKMIEDRESNEQHRLVVRKVNLTWNISRNVISDISILCLDTLRNLDRKLCIF